MDGFLSQAKGGEAEDGGVVGGPAHSHTAPHVAWVTPEDVEVWSLHSSCGGKGGFQLRRDWEGRGGWGVDRETEGVGRKTEME